MTKPRKRFIQAVIETARQVEAPLPWHRGQRAARSAVAMPALALAVHAPQVPARLQARQAQLQRDAAHHRA